jgi:hypothetical protein
MRIELFEVPSSEASSTSPPQAAVDAVHVEHPPPGRVGGDDQLAGGESLVPLMNCRLAGLRCSSTSSVETVISPPENAHQACDEGIETPLRRAAAAARTSSSGSRACSHSVARSK